MWLILNEYQLVKTGHPVAAVRDFQIRLAITHT